ncbi:MAG: alpha-E domain-containing protein [Opitutaceae bacterium]|nr:alpha-E domain-containing protein [Cytophagales bacterium]
MLSRIANSLFWMGRYIERAEHMARYTRVQYFSALDAPIAQKKEMVLESILSMAGLDDIYKKTHDKLVDEEVLTFLTTDLNHPFSIISNISFGRENARGARDTLSSELWESINKYYHAVNDFSMNSNIDEDIYDFSMLIMDNSAIVKGYIDNTLFRNLEWSIINLGIHLERAIQITRILISKLEDIERIEKSLINTSVENYQWATLLKSCESFDMLRRHYKTSPSRKNCIEFLLLNKFFPKSLYFNLSEVQRHMQILALHNSGDKGTIEFNIGKLTATFQYLQYSEIENRTSEFLNETIDKLYKIGERLDSEFFGR